MSRQPVITKTLGTLEISVLGMGSIDAAPYTGSMAIWSEDGRLEKISIFVHDDDPPVNIESEIKEHQEAHQD